MLGSSLSDFSAATASDTRTRTPSSDEAQPVSVAAASSGTGAPLHVMPKRAQRNDVSGPSVSAAYIEAGSKICVSGGAEQSSWFVTSTTARNASGRRKPAFSAGAGAPSAPSARSAAAKGWGKLQPASTRGHTHASASASSSSGA